MVGWWGWTLQACRAVDYHGIFVTFWKRDNYHGTAPAVYHLDLETTTIARVRLPTTMKTIYIFSNFLDFSGVRLPTTKKQIRVPCETPVQFPPYSSSDNRRFLSPVVPAYLLSWGWVGSFASRSRFIPRLSLGGHFCPLISPLHSSENGWSLLPADLALLIVWVRAVSLASSFRLMLSSFV